MKRHLLLYIGLTLVVSTLVWSCAKTPPNLTPNGRATFQADQAIVALEVLVDTATGLNKIQQCDPAPCHPLLSNANTRVVLDNVETAVKAMQGVPSGWKATSISALEEIQRRLDAAGKSQLATWLSAATTVINSIL